MVQTRRWTGVRRLVAGVLFAALAAMQVAAAAGADALAVSETAESILMRRMNTAREERGLSPLTRNLQMMRLAREWAATMADNNKVAHRPDLADAVDGQFVRLADNVGYTRLTGASPADLANRLHDAFMSSSGHRDQILGRFNQAGVGTFLDSAGGLWAAVVFLQGPIDGFPLYTDLDHIDDRPVERLFVHGSLRACSRERFCPGVDATRRWAADLIDRTVDARGAANLLDGQCGGAAYCYEAEISRIVMARLLAAALKLEPQGGARFDDVPAADEGIVNAVVAAGLMAGCSDKSFCSTTILRRVRVAVIVERTLR